MPPHRRRLTLTAARPLSASVRSLVFAVDGPPLDYRAGQSLQLLVPSASGLVMRRPYSIASAPGHAGPRHVEIAVTLVAGGPTSTALHALPVGAVVEAEGPQGGWLSRRADERGARTLYVAAGSGLAPLRAMIQQDLAGPEAGHAALLFGCRTLADVLWADELAAWAAARDRFALTVSLSRPDEGWRGPTGYVQRHVTALARELDPELVLVCGLSPMADAVEAELTAAGVAPDVIRAEAFDR